MARFTTDFLTWLKGLFYTETEVDTLLDKKINTVDVQAKVTSFTNKDRINIDRLINYMENGSGTDYYTLDLIGKYSTIEMTAASSSSTDIWSDDKKRLAMTTSVSGSSAGHYMCFGGLVSKGGTAQPNNTDTITFKLIDGTVLGTATLKRTEGTGNGYRFYQANYKNGLFDTPGIYYVYAEATISGSVVKSNILSVFVKDNKNLIEYNNWSGTDYNQDTTNYYSSDSIKISSSNIFSSIGERSLKILSPDVSGWPFVDLFRLTGIKGNVTGNITVYSPDGDLFVVLYCRDPNENISSINVPSTDSPVTISLSGNIPSNSYISFRVFPRVNNATVFVDDVRISYQ